MNKMLLTVLLAAEVLLLPGKMTLTANGDEQVNTGQQQEGWTVENREYYFYRSGQKVKGILRQNGNVYYLSPKTGARMTGVVKIGKKYYFFDLETGARKRGLIHYGGEKYYFSKKWYAVKGFQKVGKKLVYCDQTGRIGNPSGIVTYQGKRYYYDPKTGKQKTGWIRRGNYTYYFSRKKKYALTGWQTISGKEYYFNSKGILLCNRWIKDRYYVDDNGKKVKGLLRLGDETYYLDPLDGRLTTGFQKVDSNTYYFDEDGLMVRSQWVEDRWLDASGAMAENTWVGAFWVGKDGKKTGKERSTGFFSDGGNTYYLNSDFQPLTGWVRDMTGYYYFDEATGILRKNLWVGDYYVGSEGKRVTDSFYVVDGDTYYFQEDGLPATGLLFLEDDGYYFDRMGVMQTGFVELNGVRFYFQPGTGKMTVSQELAIKGVRYLFDEEGHLIKETIIAANVKRGQEIADYAMLFLGNPYKSGGTSLTEGVDSSGFTQAVLAHFDIRIPRLSSNQVTGESPYGGSYQKPQKIQIKDLQPGDLVFYGNPVNHVGIYLGNRKIIHAFNSKEGIIISRYDYKTITACARYW